ncbi:type I restriction-modification system restriction endonuclease DNA specificity subunit HsdS [Aeromonas hydrophila]|uniref:methylation-associated defense system restriction endonuclease subunit S MAD5 n=1 Tax=Aeromonas hydrophila TaxID=644 RepID=UPI0015DCEDE2|nr:restriction endonuclease subunit S [Aeromonas hydrophila]BBT07838.1 type I restriction-modification system restriction endonuclease DNA specificity subunit HsdS [Aeromonas hydrophila]
MTFANFKNAKIVRSAWLESSGRRLDCNPYMSGALEAIDTLNALHVRKDRLDEVTDDIFDSGRESRSWVDDPAFGVPYMGTSSILYSDLTTLPLISSKQVRRNPRLPIDQSWSLITRSGSIGRMAYVRPDMVGMTCSEDVLRVVANQSKISPGYLYAFLACKYGVPLIVSGTYGAIIQHIEPVHVNGIEIPRFGELIESQVHQLVEKAALLRSQYQAKLNQATGRLLSAAGIEDCPAHVWNKMGPETGFSASISISHSMRAANYSKRIHKLLGTIESSGATTLGEICDGGQLGTGARFKRIDCDPEEGIRLVGQKQGFWMRPEGRWIAPRYTPKGVFATNESVLIASSGTLGESEVYCRPILVTGKWLDFAYTQHFLRVVSGNSDFPGAYLFAFLRSEVAFRALRSMSTGSKQQEIHLGFVSRLPIPILTSDLRVEIAETVRSAFIDRDRADSFEDKALRIVEEAIKGGAA